MINVAPFAGGQDQVEYTIGELSRLYGVSLRTLRFYEEKEFLRPRRAGLSRFYSARDKIRLELVLMGKRLGFTLAEIWELIEARSGEAENSAEKFSNTLNAPLIERQIEQLESRRDEVNGALQELYSAYRNAEDLGSEGRYRSASAW